MSGPFDEGVVAQFESTYVKKTKHRKKCRCCGKLIDDGTKVEMRRVQTEKYYPVKGIMRFSKWQFAHVECIANV